MNRLSARLLAVLVAAVPLGAQARTLPEVRASGTLRLATLGDIPPYADSTESGLMDGFLINLGERLGLKLGLRVEWSVVRADTASAGLLADRYDAVLGNQATVRSSTLAFSAPITCSSGVLLAKAQATGGITTSAFLTRQIGVQGGSVASQQLGGLNFKKARVFGTMRETASALIFGNVDAVLVDRAVAQSVIREYPLAGLAFSSPLYRAPSVLSVRQGNAALLGALNTAIRQVQAGDTSFREQAQALGVELTCTAPGTARLAPATPTGTVQAKGTPRTTAPSTLKTATLKTARLTPPVAAALPTSR